MFFHKSLNKRLWFSLPIQLVFGIIFYEFYCYHKGYMWEGQGGLASHSFIYALVFLLVWCYITAMTSSPGFIPKEFEAVPGSKPFEPTHCKFCDKVRPPRTHHCRVCEVCVLRQDHHCPWIGNCVGIENHRYFIQFLVYATFATGFVGSANAGFYLRSEDYNFHTVFGAVAGLILSVGIGGLTGFNLWGMLTNRTSIEAKRNPTKNLWDTNEWKENLEQVFGKRILAYFLPIETYGKISGVEYPYTLQYLDQDDEAE